MLLAAARVAGGNEITLALVTSARCSASRMAVMASGLLSSMPIRHWVAPSMCIRYVHAGDDPVGLLAHQQVVAGDVGFALGAVDDQRVDGVVGAGIELDAGGKARAAKSDDARPADALAQFGGIALAKIGHGFGQVCPGVFAVGLDDSAEAPTALTGAAPSAPRLPTRVPEVGA